MLAALALGPVLPAQAEKAATPGYADDELVGVQEKLGEMVPLDLEFRNEKGEKVVLRDLVKRPTVLTLVYFRCPTICSPLLREVAHTVEESDIVPGVDYDLITVSFDVKDTLELAARTKEALLGELDKKVPPDSWHFLLGDPENIAKLTDAVGFRFKQDKQDFAHAATVVFLSPDGKIVRYLGGLSLLPADLKLAVLDAANGQPRTLIQRIQKLCYAYDPEGKTYVLKVNRIVLVVTLLMLGAFLAVLLVRRKPAAETTPPIERTE